MRPPDRVPRPRDYLSLLAQGWIIIVCATLLSAGMGWLASHRVYQSSSRVFEVTPGGATSEDAYYGNLSSQSRTLTFQQLAKSSLITKRIIDRLGLHKTPDELAKNITVAGAEGTLLTVVVYGDDPNVTRATADAVTTEMIVLSRELAAVDTSAPELVLVDPAGPAVRSGTPYQYPLLGGALGLVLSAVLVIARGLVRENVTGRSQAAHIVAEETAEADR
jgi:capsular polysaccharide biosynthesis protein